MAILTLRNYKNKGIYAYICPLTVVEGKLERGKFENGTPSADIPGNKERFYKGKSAVVEFNLANYPDGWYEYKEEGSTARSSIGYIRIESGEIAEEAETKEQLLNLICPIESEDQLPDLTGSWKQINWANQIRAKALREGLPFSEAIKHVQATYWIDNRNTLGS